MLWSPTIRNLQSSRIESLEDALKHGVIRSDAPLKYLSEKKFPNVFFRSCDKLRRTLGKVKKMKKLKISGYIQRRTLIRSSLESLEDALKHAVISSDAPLKCLSEKIPVM